MLRRRVARSMVVAMVLHPAVACAQATAYVRTATGDHGNALLFTQGDACYALTPLHVLWNDTRGTRSNYAQLTVARVGGAAIEAQGDLCAVVPDIDLALLRLSGVQRNADCGGPLLGAPKTDALLSANADAWLGTTSETGRVVGSALVKRVVSSGDANSFYASSAASQDRLTEGMSGSLVSIRDQPVGMLLSINNRTGDPNAGAARVLRLDGMATRVGRLFSSRSDAETVNPACFVQARAPAAGSRAVAAGGGKSNANLASAICGARPSAWSVAPSSENERPENLVAPERVGLWRVHASNDVTVDIRLCASAAGTVSTLTIDTSTCLDKDNIDYDVEAMVRSAPRGSFATLSFGKLPTNGRLNLTSPAALKGDELRLRFVPRSAKASDVCVASIQVQ